MFHQLVLAVAPGPGRHHAAGELVHDHDFVLADDVLLVQPVQMQHGGRQRGALPAPVFAAQRGQRHAALAAVQAVMLGHHAARQFHGLARDLGGVVFLHARND
ncbi:hypothetical protein G6F22_019726 [Rhizopus arrhizus]|nr:hypothetical protein G6F22_019726 [Rhizopus arrhizus]